MASWMKWMGAAGVLAVLVVPGLAWWMAHPGSGFPPPWVGWIGVATMPALQKTWAAMTVTLVVGAWYAHVHFSGDRSTPAGSDVYGTAHWGRPETARGVAKWTAGSAHNPTGLVVGASPTRGRVRQAWVVVQDGHAILLGAPGSGKSTVCLLPTLAVLAQSGAGIIVTDPKGEMYQTASGLLELEGYTVVRVDFRHPEGSATWNALSGIVAALRAQDAAGAARLARELASVLAEQGAAGGEHSAFFKQSTTALLTALILLVADQAPLEASHLGTVYHTLINTPKLDDVFAALPPHHPAALAYGPVRLSGQETRQNQLTVAATALALWADPSVVALTGRDSVAWADLAQKKMAVFVVIPDESSAFYGAAALFVQQQLQMLSAAAAREPGQRLRRPVYLVLDEFGNLPQLPDFDKTLNVGRGKGIHVVMALQVLSQLAARYGDRLADAMQNACNTWVYLGGNDVGTAKVLSEKSGMSTVHVSSQSRAQGGRQDTTSLTGRALLTPDEILRWPWGESLVLQMGALPLRFKLRRYTDWKLAWGPSPDRTLASLQTLPLWTPAEAVTADPAAPAPDPAPYRILRG